VKSIRLKPGIPEDSRLQPNQEPLYKRLPTHDEDGKYLSDFMMLIPGLRNLPATHFNSRLSFLHNLLMEHEDVVFADLNTPLNLLWISVRARHGIIGEVSTAIRIHIPEARLVGHTVIDNQPVASRQARFEGVRARISALLETAEK